MTNETTTYHWVLSLKGAVNGQWITAGDFGTLAVPPGFTRSRAYNQLRESILADVLKTTGFLMTDVTTVCWSLEPDQL